MRETGYAKINLALHVRGRRADGYHDLETLFAFAEHGDRLSVTPCADIRLAVVGPFAEAIEGDNLVTRAAEALRDRYGVEQGALLRLEKNLPVASGIGGGSADAAAALRLLVRGWRLDPSEAELLEIAASLGADVPACIASRTARGEGRGDRLTPIAARGLAGLPMLLVNPGTPLSTAAIFAGWDGQDHGPLSDGPALDVAIDGRNDLTSAALALAPAVGDALAMLESASGLLLARMSGSGATCFGLFENEAFRDSAREAIAAAHPDWWLMASRIR